MGLGSFVSKAVNKGLNLASHVPGARNLGAVTAGAIGTLTPAVGPLQGFRNAAFQVAHNATNPELNIYGQPNPTSGAAPAPMPQVSNNPGQVLAAETGQMGGGGAGGAGAPGFDQIGRLRGEVSDLLNRFRSAYDAVLGQVDTLAASRQQEVQDAYNQQANALQGQYTDTSQGINNALGARGILNSSYQAGEQGAAKQAYEDSVGSLNKSREGDLGNIGQFVTQEKASLAGGVPNINPQDYSSVSDLLDVKNSVDKALQQIGVTQAGLGTNSDYVRNLRSVVPAATSPGEGALKSQLDRLAATNADPTAKFAIASQAISNSGADPNQWLDYFQKLIQQAPVA